MNSVYAQYSHDLERQHGTAERTIETQIPAPEPRAQLRFTDTGLEFVGRYPIDIRRASEIDDKVIRQLMEVIESDPALKAAVAGPLKLQSAIKT